MNDREKELKEMGVLDKKGLFIGIGGGKTLNEDFNKIYSEDEKVEIQIIAG